MDGLLDFYAAIAIFAGYALPFLVVAWALESWWMGLPRYQQRRILRKMGVK
jgi:hypothetical protein